MGKINFKSWQTHKLYRYFIILLIILAICLDVAIIPIKYLGLFMPSISLILTIIFIINTPIILSPVAIFILGFIMDIVKDSEYIGISSVSLLVIYIFHSPQKIAWLQNGVKIFIINALLIFCLDLIPNGFDNIGNLLLNYSVSLLISGIFIVFFLTILKSK